MENQNPNPADDRQEDPQAPAAPAPAAPAPGPPPAAYANPYERPKQNPFEKTPILAGFLSIVPGLGNIYNGLYLRGLAFCLVCSGMFILAASEEIAALVPFVIFFWLFNVIDAYRQAMLINYGYAGEVPDLEAARRPEWQASGGLILGVAISLVGLYGLAMYFFPSFDLSQLLEYWWVVFLLFGPWLVFKSIQEKRSADSSEGADDFLAIGRHDSGADEEAA